MIVSIIVQVMIIVIIVDMVVKEIVRCMKGSMGFMTKNKRFTMDNPNDWGFPITDNVTGKVYNCASNILMKELCVVVNTIVEENEQLKQEIETLQEQLAHFDIGDVE